MWTNKRTDVRLFRGYAAQWAQLTNKEYSYNIVNAVNWALANEGGEFHLPPSSNFHD